MANDSLTSVHRALDVVRALGSGPLGVQAVAEALDAEKTQISRTLKVLLQEGFVERDPKSLEYRLGWQLYALAGAAGDDRLRQDAPRALRALVHELGEAAYLTVREGDAALTVLSEQAGRSVQAREWIGRGTPLNCTSSGRALLFGLADAEITTLLTTRPGPLPGTRRAPRTVAAVLRRLRQERAAGHVVAAEEHEIGLTAVAAPVLDFRGTPLAAVNVSVPSFRLTPDGLERIVQAVTATAADLSAGARN
ncbi:IclR family transcriptional regulator [Amycolatopsis sp. NBC_00438]|uniref:IclR family transcriptional regulator n=1 Tax=Amycolatopsis sp. NBC_00438 TaxID=2903558 RepID=UPI002E209BF5